MTTSQPTGPRADVRNRWPELLVSDLQLEPQKNGLTRPKAVRGAGTKMVNMGELFAFDRINNCPMDRVPLSDNEQHFLLRPGDLLFARQSLVLEGAGRCVLFQGDEEDATFESHIIRVRLDPARAHSPFYYYWFRSPEGRDRIRSIVTQVAAAGIRGSDLSRLAIPAPPLPTQMAISSILGALDDRIDLNRRMNETLEELARTIFKSWFVDFDPVRARAEGRRPLGMDAKTAAMFPDRLVCPDGATLPETWVVSSLGELCQIGRGGSPRPINDYMNGEIPWIKISDATAAGGPFVFETKERLKTSGVDKSVSVSPGDLILSNSASCGIPVFIELSGCIHDGWLWFRELRRISKLYLFHALRELSAHLVHIADGSVQKNLNTALVGQQNVLVPPASVAQAFEDLAGPMFLRIRANGLESRSLVSLRDALLPKLISGELRIKDAEKLAEAVL